MSHRNGEAVAVLETAPLACTQSAQASPTASKTYESVHAEWKCVLAPYPAFAQRMDDTDTDCATYGELAQLMRDAPTLVAKHVIREAVACRRERDDFLGLTFTATTADQAVFAAADQEWSDILDGQPLFKRWLSLHDRLTCSQATISEAMRRAPSIVIRHAMRELFLFRTVTALYTPLAFE